MRAATQAIPAGAAYKSGASMRHLADQSFEARKCGQLEQSVSRLTSPVPKLRQHGDHYRKSWKARGRSWSVADYRVSLGKPLKSGASLACGLSLRDLCASLPRGLILCATT
ncbi:hypothetical protein ACVIWV_000437 [Bradyrhizobium diazoefficiens]|jgi:hypothetical protein